MINEYIKKTNLAINEGLKNVKKGKIDKETCYHVIEEYFNNIYHFIKDNPDDIDDEIIAQVYSLENRLNDFIISFNPNLNAPNEVENSDSYLLETIVYFTRKQLRVKESIEFSTDSLRKYDKLANNYVKDMCERLGLRCYSINVGRLLDIPKNHNICIVQVNSHYYLVDSTYQQYFLVGQNFQERYIKNASNILTCEIGSSIIDENKQGVITLLERGFISTEDKMFEDYFNVMLKQANKKALDKSEYLNMIIHRKKKNNS